MRLLLVAAVAAVLAAGCGGGKKTTFTNENYQTLVDHPTKYTDAHVDVVGNVAQVAHDESGVSWLLVYVDVAHAASVTLVDLGDSGSTVAAQQLVHVVGTVKQGLTVPFDLGGYESAPVVLAEEATVATSTTG